MKQRRCRLGYKTQLEIQKYKDVNRWRMSGFKVSLLFCKNCDYAIIIADKNYDCEKLHWVCPVCFMPSENNNPFKKEFEG